MFASSDRRFVQFVDVARVQQFVSATNNKIRLIFKIGVDTTCPLMILIDETREVVRHPTPIRPALRQYP
jgi:hypothetical protein